MPPPTFSKGFLELLGTGKPAEPPPSDRLALGRYLAALRSGAPMQWMSDHLAEDQRLRGAVYVAIKVLGEQAAASEVHAYELDPEAEQEGDEEARKPLSSDHPICELLKRPNPHETGGELRERQVQQLSLTGTSLSIKVRDGLGTVRELWSEPTGTYQPVPISAYYPNGGYRFLPWFPGPLASIPGVQASGGVVVPSEEVLAVRYPHPLLPAGEGLSPLHACRLPMDTLEMIDRGRMSRMRRGTDPSAVAEVDPTVAFPEGDDLTALRREINNLLGGPDKAGAIALLSPGIKLTPWGANELEVGWIESWGQLLGLTLACFGVAKSMAYLDDDQATFASLYARLRQFNLMTLCPILNRLAGAYNRELVWPVWGTRFGVEFRPQAVTNEEDDDRKVARAQVSGSITHNELRKKLGWEPTKEAWGEERAFAGKGPEQGQGQGGPGEGGDRDPLDRQRPENAQGLGSLGDRRILTSRAGSENGQANGVAHR